MKEKTLTLIFLILTNLLFGQESDNGLKMISEYSSENPEIRDILEFEGIQYLKVKFIGKELKDKSYHLTVKEFWDGKVVRDTTLFNSKNIGIKQLKTVNDTILNLNVISKMTPKNKLKMTFRFPRFYVTEEFDAIETDEYSLRNIADEGKMEIGYNKKFYLFAYILPYEKEDGIKSYCEVGSNGKEIEKWGEKFGIKHYILFEMEFE